MSTPPPGDISLPGAPRTPQLTNNMGPVIADPESPSTGRRKINHKARLKHRVVDISRKMAELQDELTQLLTELEELN